MSRVSKVLATPIISTAPTFDPGTLTELKIWYKTPLPGPPNDGDTVLIWPDSSGNSNDSAFVFGAAGDITYKTGIKNGNAVIRSQNAARVGDSPVIDLSAGFEVFMVARAFFPVNFFGIWQSPFGEYGCITGTTFLDCYDSGFVHQASQSLVPDNWNILSAVYATNAITASVNGVAGTPVAASYTWPSNRAFEIFGPSGTSALQGDCGEVLLCTPVLSPTNRTHVINDYLKPRWAIS